MKNTKYIIIVLISLFSISWTLSPQYKKIETTENSSIKVTISLPKDTFFVGESIPLKITFKNASSKIDSIALLNEDEVAQRIEVFNQSNAKAKYKGAVLSYLKTSYKKLKPNEEMTFDVDVQYHYGFKSFTSRYIMNMYYYFEPGTYTVKSEFDKNICEDDNDLNIKSNTIKFTVIKENVGNLSELEKLTEIYTSSIFGGEDRTRTAILSLLNLLAQYPNTIYYHKAYDELRTYLVKYNIQMSDKSNEYLNFIHTYPNSNYTKTALLLYAHSIAGNSSKENAVATLQDIKNMTSNTNVSNYVDYILQMKYFKSN